MSSNPTHDTEANSLMHLAQKLSFSVLCHVYQHHSQGDSMCSLREALSMVDQSPRSITLPA